MGKKKIQNLLKGVAITGTAIGGASVLGDADLVYAQTAEEVTNEISEGTVTVEVSHETYETPVTEQTYEAPAASAEQTGDASVAGTELEGEEGGVEGGTEGAPVMMTMAAPVFSSQAELAPAATTGSENEEEIVIGDDELWTQEEYDEHVASLSIATSEFESTSEFVSTSLQTEESDLTTALTEAQDYYDANSQTFVDSGFENADKVKQLDITAKQAEIEQAKLQEYYNANKNLNTGYYNEQITRQLARELIRYQLVSSGELTYEQAQSIEFKYWDADKDRGEDLYECKNFVARYFRTGENGEQEYVERYFDYVTAGPNNESLFEGGEISPHDSQKVTGINVLEKKPIFADTPTKTVTVFGQKLKVAQRTGFEVCEEQGSGKKGNTFYKESDFLTDLANYNGLTKAMNTLSQTITTLTGQKTDLVTTAQTKNEELNGKASTLNTAKNYIEAQAKAIAKKAQEALLNAQAAQDNEDDGEDIFAGVTPTIMGVIGSPTAEVEEPAANPVAAAITNAIEKIVATETNNAAEETAATSTATSGQASAESRSTSTTSASTVATTATVNTVATNEMSANENTLVTEEANTTDTTEYATPQLNATYNTSLSEAEVPLAVIDEQREELASPAISELVKEADIRGITDESVAKGHIGLSADAGKKGFMWGLLVLVATKLGYDKYKEDTNPNK